MISGIVAQEFKPLPHGVLAPLRAIDSDDAIFITISTSGLDQHVMPGTLADQDQFYATNLPQVLTSNSLFGDWQDGEVVFAAVVARDVQLLVGFFTSPDTILSPDIRVPGMLMPALFTDADIFPATGSILDPGMLRQVASHVDVDITFTPTVYVAETLLPQRVVDLDLFHAPTFQGSVLRPPLLVSDDFVFNFGSAPGFFPSLFIDSGRPVLPPTSWDGPNSGVTITSDGLTAALTAPANYCGARSSLSKNSGKFYWEITLGPSHGFNDQAGILRDDASFTNMAQDNFSVSLHNNYLVAPADFGYYGVVIGNGLWYCYFGHIQTGTGLYAMADGDVIGIAVDISNRQCWFRCNGGPWNNDMWGDIQRLGQDPETGYSGIPLPIGLLEPAVTLGGSAGTSQNGFAGDNFTANFGAKAYRDSPPSGYTNWELDSPLGASVNGDSFGRGVIGIPAALDGSFANVTMSNSFLTATHNTTTDYSGAESVSQQQSGKYYWEVTIGLTHGRFDSVGFMAPEGSFASLAGGYSGNMGCFLFDGAISANGSNSGKTIGAVVAGDVVGVAIDLDDQTTTQGGLVWFRKSHAGAAGNWNGATLPSDSDPATGSGGIAVQGFSFSKTWAPAVGFSGSGTSVGDSMTANFGATPSVMPRPNGFAIWPIAYNDSVQALTPGTVLGDDTFLAPFIDTSNRQLFHPNSPTNDDAVFPASSFGGNLPLFPVLVADADVFYSGGNFASFDLPPSPQVTVSNKNLTVAQSVATTNVGARSSAQQRAGKYYFEITCTVTHTAQNALGIAMETATYANLCVNAINGTFLLCNTGTIFSNNANSGKSLLAPVNGDILGFAIDLDLRKAWVRKNNGLWNNTTGADPVLNVSGVIIQSLQSFSPVVAFGAAATGDSYTANFGGSAFANPAPAGFSPWPNVSTTQPRLTASLVTDSDTLPAPRIDPQTLAPAAMANDDVIYLLSGSGGIPTVGPSTVVNDAETVFAPAISAQLASFDGVATNVSLSTDKLTATHTNTTTDSGARSTANKTTGKYYFEVTMTNVHGAFDCAGVIVAAGTYNNLVTGSLNCTVTYRNTGAIYSSNISSGKTLGAIAVGDVIGVAIDLTARRAWFRKNAGLWNGLALTSENPNTGIGGVVMAATVSNAPAIGFGGTGTLSGDTMTANFGATAYSAPAPTGFQNWTT